MAREKPGGGGFHPPPPAEIGLRVMEMTSVGLEYLWNGDEYGS